MFKRILVGAIWAMVAFNAAYLAVRVVQAWDLWPDRGLDREAARFREAIELIRDHYAGEEKVDPEALTERALEGLLDSLDPHSEFLPRRRFESVQSELRAEFGGIGVQIELRDERVTVIAPIAGTPGERAGILRGDQILAVDGKPLEPPVLNNAVERLRGRPGTVVSVGLRRPSTGEERTVELRREVIKVESVRTAEIIAPGIGYLHLTQFSERSGAEFRAALERLEAAGMQALVLDLRNNPGGLLDVALEVAEPFFARDELVVYTQGPSAESRRELRARGDTPRRTYPVAVLVNSGSASAAEVVTGALRDTGRAVVIGERTFGKGSVQTLLPLRTGDALRLTTARYFTPRGVTIHGRGIEPDVELPVPVEEEAKLVVQRLRRDFGDAKEFEDRFGFAPVEDRQLAAAVDVLRGVLAFPIPPAAAAAP